MTPEATRKHPEQQVGRYAIFDEIACGGMASVHLARLMGSGGFCRVVAAKRMHRQFLQDPNFRRMFLVEAQLAARIVHPNVVPILDVLSDGDELIIIMEYVHGESLIALMQAARKAKRWLSVPIGCAIVAAVLEGLHAAHEARDERGEALDIVHRDMSPHNVIVGADGVARVLDFGIAKAVHKQPHTNPGTLKGKCAYMAPELVRGSLVTRQVDIFSVGVMLWEVLAGRRLFRGSTEAERLLRIVSGDYPSIREQNPDLSVELDQVVSKAIQVDPSKRYSTALEFAVAIEQAVPGATRREVGHWVRDLAAESLDARAVLIHDIEALARVTPPPLPMEHTRAHRKPVSASAGDEPMQEIDRSPEPLFGGQRRRLLSRRWLVLATVATAVAALIVVVLSARRAAPTARTTASTPAIPASPAEMNVATRPPEVPPAIPDIATPTAVPALEPPQPVVADKRTRAPVPSRRSPTSPNPKPRTSSHAKPYLPSSL